MPLPAAFCMAVSKPLSHRVRPGLLGLPTEPYLLEGIFEQRLPGHVDLYVTGERIGLKTKTKTKTPRRPVSSEERCAEDRTARRGPSARVPGTGTGSGPASTESCARRRSEGRLWFWRESGGVSAAGGTGPPPAPP